MSLSSSLSSPQELFGLLFAPLLVPWKRRLETLAVCHFIFLWVILPLVSVWLPIYLLFTPLRWLVMVYGGWTWYDWRTPRRGSRPWRWYKNSRVWRHFADYFPLKLVKTAELDPSKNYIFGSHPHGVLSIGAFTAFTTSATGFPELFPGITASVLTLTGQFFFPLRRDVGEWLGGVDASPDSLRWLLQNPGRGRAIAIVLGGAEEALDAHPSHHDLNLNSRRGFCRFALQYGADLVPMYNFGENDVYEQSENPHGSRLRRIQSSIKRRFGFCPPLMRGRGLFNYSFGILPFRRPITTVLGAPISVDRTENPTMEEVESLHAKYCSSLVELFEKHKHLHNIPSHVHLNIY